MTDSCSSGTVN